MDLQKNKRQAGFTLIELLIVIIVIGILAAIAIPMFLGQRNKAKEASVKEGLHSIQVAVHTYAVDYKDVYPAVAKVTQANLVDPKGASYCQPWPKNPWTQAYMAQGTTKGSFSYTVTTTTYKLIGRGKSGTGIITVP